MVFSRTVRLLILPSSRASSAAKDRLRREIADFDTVRSKEVKRAVDAYLRAYCLIERDSKAYFLNAEQSNPPFFVGR